MQKVCDKELNKKYAKTEYCLVPLKFMQHTLLFPDEKGNAGYTPEFTQP